MPSHLHLFLAFCLTLLSARCQSQNKNEQAKPIGGLFENSEFFFYGLPENLYYSDTSGSFFTSKTKLQISGRVLHKVSNAPVSNAILYYYQTNEQGLYLHKPEVKESMPPNKHGQTHGYIRGWLKTNAMGEYRLLTGKPGTYPSRTEPAHIHLSILEPDGKTLYYLDDFTFDDDPYLNKQNLTNRGGSGVLRLAENNGLLYGERNIYLGLNIPNYPIRDSLVFNGLKIGEEVKSFTPYHVWGPDKGSKTCPVCKYGWYHGILFFISEKSTFQETKVWLSFFEELSQKQNKHLKVYLVFSGDNSVLRKQLVQLGQELDIKNVAITTVPSFDHKKSDVFRNKLSLTDKSTLILYKRSIVTGKYLNPEPTEQIFEEIKRTLQEGESPYFFLPQPKHD